MPKLVAQPIRARIRQEVTDRILDGRLPPLSPVRHAEVAEELGVSVTPLREALIELAREGLLEARPNRGFVVAPFGERELRDLYETIGMLETAALRGHLPEPSRYDRLEALNRDLGEAGGDPWRAVKLDIEWHRELLADDPNEIRREVLDGLKLRAVRYAYAYLREVGRIPRSVEQHGTILERLRAGDVAAAVRELEDNWRPRRMLEWLEDYEKRTSGAAPLEQPTRSRLVSRPPPRA